MTKYLFYSTFCFLLIFSFAAGSNAQSLERKLPLKAGGLVEVTNLFGQIDIKTSEEAATVVELKATSTAPIKNDSINVKNSGSNIKIKVSSPVADQRIDLALLVPKGTKLRLKTNDGQISVSGFLGEAKARTNTGTIYADVPLTNLKYKFIWNASRPRIVSQVELDEFKEKSAGKFVIKGKLDSESEVSEKTDSEDRTDEEKSLPVSLEFRTARGIILLNVPPDEVPSDLTERELTTAAKAVIRSGDTLLTEAIRRASPKHFGDYASTLPPSKRSPFLTAAAKKNREISATTKKVNVQVVDINNRSISDLQKPDFLLTERGDVREVISVESTQSPFNLVLLLDVSGSIENYVDFIRKAARNFVNTVGPKDKLSIVIFNEDVNTLSTFTTDKEGLSESLDTFDAGGGTAYYDSIAYVLTDTLKPMKGERTAIVILSDGDDNKSFLPFKSLLGSIQESGALVYPLYVPSGLIAASESDDPNKTADPLRNRFLALSLTSKAHKEGEELAKISGGVYYPITQISELQTAYNDIVKQLRTSYTLTYRSKVIERNADRASPRLKVKVKRDNAFVKLGTVVAVEDKQVSKATVTPLSSGRSADFVNAKFEKRSASLEVELPEITGEIDSIKYKQFLADKLRSKQLTTFDVNKSPGAFLVEKDDEKIAVSRWISPKRTRSYPYERVYDTLAHSGKKVAIIPVVKDEGLGGDRDFIQWDTISLLSLLDVHVVLAYYDNAIKNPKRKDKITKQKFSNEFIKSKLEEVFSFQGKARDWNEREARNLKSIFEKAKFSYRKIAKKTATYLHNEDRLNERIKYAETPQRFIGYSRRRSRSAQRREYLTIQPNEALSTLSKGKITITNALFGKFYFTVDETIIEPTKLSLIEAKHTSRSKMPSKNDIKDGLIKMMLYTNLRGVKFGKKSVNHKVAIRLTSGKIEGSIDSNSSDQNFERFAAQNLFKPKKLVFLKKLFEEARANRFTIILEEGETSK